MKRQLYLFLLFLGVCNVAFSQTYISGWIGQDATWKKSNSPYIISGNVSVSAYLTIEAGTIVKFNKGSQLLFDSRGGLSVNGVLNDSVVFTSNSSEPQAGDWNQLMIDNYSRRDSYVNYARIEYATYGLTLNNSNSTIKNSLFRNCSKDGIMLLGSEYSASIDFCTFQYNTNGINCYRSINKVKIAITNSLFERNLTGIYNYRSSVDFTNCTIINNAENGIYDMGAPSKVENCEINGNSIGINDLSYGSSYLQNKIMNNIVGIRVNSYYTFSAINCNTISSNYFYNLLYVGNNLHNNNPIVNATHNYFGTDDENLINKAIYDQSDDSTLNVLLKIKPWKSAENLIIVKQPIDNETSSGDYSQLIVQTNDTNVTYQWFKDTQPLTESENFTGISNDTLTIKNNSPVANGTYFCKVSSFCESKVSDIITLAHTLTDRFLVSSSFVNLSAADGSESSVTISTDLDWTVVSDQSWLSVDPDLHSGNGIVSLKASENTGGTRKATVKFSPEGLTSRTVTVIQNAASTLSVFPSFKNLKPNGNEKFYLMVYTDSVWTATTDQDWIQLDSIQTCTGTCKLVANCEDNNSGTHRTGTITFSANGIVSKEVTLFQPKPLLSVTPNSLIFPSNNYTYNEISIKSNLDWAISSDQQWVQIIPTSGNGDKEITIRNNENKLPTDRYAVVTIKANGVNDQTISIKQKGYYDEHHSPINHAYIYNHDAIEIDGYMEDTWVNCGNEHVIERNLYGIENPTVYATWRALCDRDNFYVLITVLDDGEIWPGWMANGNKLDYDIPLIYWDWNEEREDGLGPSTNYSGHYRFAEGFEEDAYYSPVTIIPSSKGDSNPGGTYCYSLTGDGYVYELAVPFSNFYDKDGTQITRDIAFMRTLGFDITIVDQDEGVTTEPQRMVWSSDYANSWDNMDYAGTISWSWCDPNLPDLDAFEVYKDKVDLSASGETMAIVDVFCYRNWTAVSNQPWLTVTKNSTTPRGSIILTAQANTTDAIRTAKVTVTASELGSKTISVTQGVSTGFNTFSSEKIELFPNPVINSFRLKGLKNMSSVNITDLDGRQYFTTQVSRNETIDITSLPKGIYIVEIVSESFSTKKKLIKE